MSRRPPASLRRDLAKIGRAAHEAQRHDGALGHALRGQSGVARTLAEEQAIRVIDQLTYAVAGLTGLVRELIDNLQGDPDGDTQGRESDGGGAAPGH